MTPRLFSRILCGLLITVAAMAANAGAKEDIQADMQAGRWSQADARLNDVLAKHPDNALAHYWQAQVKFREGQLDDARQHLAKAKELDPKHAFAGDKANLARFERALDKPAAAAPVSPPVARNDTVAPRQTLPAPVEPAPVTRYDPPAPKSGGNGWLWIGLIVLAGFIFWAVRSAKSRGMSGDKAGVKAKLEEALNDLRDAGKFIDTRGDLSMEQKLAMSDRVMRAQGDVQAHLATLGSRSDFGPSHELLRRVRDIAAETRGERRPSEIEAECELEMQRMRNAQMANPGMGMGMGNQGGGMGSAGAALGGLAAGVVLGGLMSGSSHARERSDSGNLGGGGGYTPIEDFDRGDSSPSIDVGGSGDGGGWDSGGSDTGGGGSDSFD